MMSLSVFETGAMDLHGEGDDESLDDWSGEETVGLVGYGQPPVIPHNEDDPSDDQEVPGDQDTVPFAPRLMSCTMRP